MSSAPTRKVSRIQGGWASNPRSNCKSTTNNNNETSQTSEESPKDNSNNSNQTKFQYNPKKKMESNSNGTDENSNGITRTQLDQTSWLRFCPNFVEPKEADDILAHLLNDTDWRQSSMTIRGKEHKLPRLQCWMSDEGVVAKLYQKEPALPWSPQVSQLKERLESLLETKFDYVLMNYYRDGKDSIGFHKDEEASEPGKNVIASLSFGATRTFIIKYGSKQYSFRLNHGSLVTMEGDTQLTWKHGIPAEQEVTQGRVNLTFRHS